MISIIRLGVLAAVSIGTFCSITPARACASSEPAPAAPKSAGSAVPGTEPEVVTAELNFRLGLEKLRYLDLTGSTDASKEDEARTALGNYSAFLATAVQSSRLTDGICASALYNFNAARVHAKSAPQVTQVAAEEGFRLSLLQIAQNRRIIELLEQLAAKKQASK